MNKLRFIIRASQPFQALGLLLVVWEIGTRLAHTPILVLPPPSDVIRALIQGIRSGLYTDSLAATLSAMGIGYVAGCATGIGLGAVVAEWRVLERLLYPCIVALQSLPKIALAPLFVMWFGFGLLSKTITIALLCFFPLLVNTMAGIAATEPDRVALLRAMAASRWQIFLQVKLPSAAGAIFAGLQVSVVLALIGALVAEFIGSDSGLGLVIEAARANLDMPGMFAALFMLAAIGLVISRLVQMVQRHVVFWERRDDLFVKSSGEQA